MDIDEYLKNKTREDYQRDNFDDFLHKIKFSYAVSTIHIAGTNGKGSTVNFIKSIYQNAGYKVGSFSTPDVFSETIKINDSPIDETYAESIINEYDHFFNKYDLSGFEIQTFIALKYFIDQNVDIAIVECGMGGEIDATNVFTPILSIITTISIEHSAFLGLSLSEIAFHKAGIIKSRVPCLVGKLNEEAMTVIFNKCKEEKSELHIVDDYFNVQRNNFDLSFDYSNLLNLKISSASTYEIEASCLAIQAVNLLNEQYNSGMVNLFTAPESGIVVYSLDGYEEVNASDVTKEWFDKSTYTKTQLVDNAIVDVGDPIYKLSDKEIEWYVETGEWHGAAGGYRIQSLASCFVKHLEGSYSGAVGLPIFELYDILKEQGYSILE